ncbi:hypothetical protein [Lactococcus garvieae]|uniref:Uncharacterized protein n=1 Tax=Lactococcus garvieae TaxID=1363 RepID=A0A1I4J589_9LACT|nr:hypothetical protein [Lactococcus garvieae]SFL61353.1 hypothetical protein SAMN05216438_1306 [Lactococcus garvieae]
MTYKQLPSKLYIDIEYIKEIMSLSKEAQYKCFLDIYQITDYKILKKTFLTVAKETTDKKIISDIKNWIKKNKKCFKVNS